MKRPWKKLVVLYGIVLLAAFGTGCGSQPVETDDAALDSATLQRAMDAMILGQEDDLRSMLKRNPELATARDKWSNTLFCYAVIIGGETDLEILLASGADINQRDPDDGRTPLHEAVSTNRPTIVQWMLEHGADPNIEDHTGQTSAALARKKGMAKLFAECIKSN